MARLKKVSKPRTGSRFDTSCVSVLSLLHDWSELSSGPTSAPPLAPRSPCTCCKPDRDHLLSSQAQEHMKCREMQGTRQLLISPASFLVALIFSLSFCFFFFAFICHSCLFAAFICPWLLSDFFFQSSLFFHLLLPKPPLSPFSSPLSTNPASGCECQLHLAVSYRFSSLDRHVTQ